jgi:acyl-CoA synthetase (NDP forming)
MSTTAPTDTTRSAIDNVLRPRSIALVGASATPGSFGDSVLCNLECAGYAGQLYLINPKRAEIRGRQCLPSIDDLPEGGVDCAVLVIPRSGVLEATAACARRGVRGLIVFSSGFAELNAQGRAEQEEMAGIARQHNMIVEGPNCLGMVNYLEGIPLTFVLTPVERLGERQGAAVLSQSGAMAAVLGVTLKHHEIPLSYSVSTGNEATTGVEDFLEYLLEDEHTHVITMIVEQFRQPRKFLALARRARELGKHIVLLHPGRTSAARASAATHTGAMAGDFKLMYTKVTHAGVVIVDTIEELVDVTQLLIHCPSLPGGGPAVLVESGVLKGHVLDFSDVLELPLPPLREEAKGQLRQFLPDFIPLANPVDLTGQGLVEPDLYSKTLALLLKDESFGSVMLSIILTDETTSGIKFPPILDAIRTVRPEKPVVFAGADEGAKISSAFVKELRALGIPFYPSPERALRALACATKYAARRASHSLSDVAWSYIPPLTAGVLPEYRSKEVLAAAGIPIPLGALASTVKEAQAIATRIGFPVVLKAQSVELCHKSDAGGVVLNLNDTDALAAGWERLHEAVARSRPGLALDGVLVEQMCRRGTELIVGAQNDPDWGPVLLVGFGGALAEAWQDVRLLVPELSPEDIVQELYQLKSAALLRGFRGAPALDVRAAAEIVCRLGALMHSTPSIQEVDINPVVVYPEGEGAVALDALILNR